MVASVNVTRVHPGVYLHGSKPPDVLFKTTFLVSQQGLNLLLYVMKILSIICVEELNK